MTTGQVTSTAQGEAAAVAGTAKDEAGNVASTAVGAAGDVAGTAKQEAGNVVGETLEQARNLTGQVKEQASQQVNVGSEKLTGSLRGLSQQLSEGDTSGVVGQVLSEVGTRVQTLADHLEQVGPQGLLSEASDYARRSPGMFLLGMAAAGFVTGRLVKGLGAGSQPSTPVLPTGTAYGDPLAGVAEPGLGASAGYITSPYPESTYEPIEPIDPVAPAPLSSPTTSGAYDPLGHNPLPGDTQSRGAL